MARFLFQCFIRYRGVGGDLLLPVADCVVGGAHAARRAHARGWPRGAGSLGGRRAEAARYWLQVGQAEWVVATEATGSKRVFIWSRTKVGCKAASKWITICVSKTVTVD